MIAAATATRTVARCGYAAPQRRLLRSTARPAGATRSFHAAAAAADAATKPADPAAGATSGSAPPAAAAPTAAPAATPSATPSSGSRLRSFLAGFTLSSTIGFWLMAVETQTQYEEIKEGVRQVHDYQKVLDTRLRKVENA